MRLFSRLTLLSGLLTGFIAGLSSPAEASFAFCNRTRSTLEAAFGYRDGTVWHSEGWWRLDPGQCSRVSSAPLTQRFYFYYAKALGPAERGEDGVRIWDGKYIFCIDQKAFKIEGDGRCEARGFKSQGFQEVDIGGRRRDYTLTFEDPDGQ